MKVSLLQDGKAVKKRKTSIRKGTLVPTWNEALNFNISEKALKKTYIEMHVMDHDFIGNDDTMGYVSEIELQRNAFITCDSFQSLLFFQISIAPDSAEVKAQYMWEDFSKVGISFCST